MIPSTTTPLRLDTMAFHLADLPVVRKSMLEIGDCLVVRTRNSCYRIVCLGDGMFRVSGGWFDKAGVSPAILAINGCTWGGTAIHPDVAAARGLFLEFGNRVLTTRIQDVRLIPAARGAAVVGGRRGGGSEQRGGGEERDEGLVHASWLPVRVACV